MALVSRALPAPAAAPPAEPSPAALARFGHEVDALRQFLKIPGLSVGVVKDGRLVWARGFGVRDRQTDDPATVATPYPVASITKTFAALAAMQLAEDGRLSLDQPVSDFLPGEPDPSAKVRDYLSHTSEGEPGSSFVYDSTRYATLARVLEAASGRPFRELLTSRIIHPLKLTHTAAGLDAPGAATIRAAMARPYRLDHGRVVAAPPSGAGLDPAHGLVSTVPDLARYAGALLDGRLLSPTSRKAMWTPTRLRDGRAAPYGLGWFVQDAAGVRVVWHFGQQDGYSGLLLIVPAQRIALVALANSSGLSEPFWLLFGNVVRSPLADAFLRDVVLPAPGADPVAAPSWEGSPDAICRRAAALQPEAGRFDEADEVAARALAFAWLGRRKESTALFEAAVARFPALRAPDPALLAAFARGGSDRLRATGAAMGRTLLERDPDNPRTLLDLGVLYLQGHESPRAVALLRRIFALPNQSNPVILGNAGELLGEELQGTDPAAARRYLQRALEAVPNGGLHDRLAQLLARLKGP